MAFKRPGESGIGPAFQFKQPKNKMPRMDRGVVTSTQILTTSLKPKIVEPIIPTKMPIFYTPVDEINLWDDSDDDDDLILSASQAVENYKDPPEQMINAVADSDSFALFSRGTKLASSTQILPAPATATTSTATVDKEMASFFNCDGDDDLIFSQLKLLDKYEANSNQNAGPPPPTSSTSSVNVQNSNRNGNTAQLPVKCGPSTSSRIQSNTNNDNIQKNICQTKDIQIRYMRSNLDKAKKDIDHLTKELEKINEKFTTKDGETSMLRYELQRKTKTVDEMRREKQNEIQKIKNEYLDKITELEKTCEELQSKLQFKDMEVIKIKSRSSDSRPMRQTTEYIDRIMPTLIFQINDMQFSQNNLPSIDYRIFSNEHEHIDVQKTFSVNFKDIPHLEHVHIIQNCLSQLLATKQCDNGIDDLMINKIRDVIHRASLTIDNHTKTITRINSQSNLIQFNTGENIETEIDVNTTICHEMKMYANEKCVPIRREILCISFIISIIPKILENHYEIDEALPSNPFFISLSNLLLAIAFSNEVESYLGVIEASSILLKSLASDTVYSSNYDAFLQNIFHTIVLCRPKIQSLCHLSEVLCKLSFNYGSSDFTNNICWQTKVPILNHMKVICYSSSSCSLQIFALLLQHEFLRHTRLWSTNEAEYLMQTTVNMLQFIRHCFMKPTNWLFNTLATNCLCRVHTISTCIILAYMCLKQWADNPLIIDIVDISTIAQLTITFLHNFLIVNFDGKVLQINPSINHKLQLLYDCIRLHYRIFSFERSHIKAMNAIDLRRIRYMIEPLRCGEKQTPEKKSSIEAVGENIWKSYDYF